MDAITINENIAVAEMFSDETINDGEEPAQPIFWKQARAYLNDLRHFLATHNMGDDVFYALHTLNVAVDNVEEQI